LYRNQTEKYPDDTSKIQFGIWEAQPSSWAGPGIDWKEQPFVLSIESIRVSCFTSTSLTPVTSTPVTSTPVTSTPVTSTPVTSTPVTSTPVTSNNANNNYILYSVLLCLQLFL
jgi:cell division septation protein DedD